MTESISCLLCASPAVFFSAPPSGHYFSCPNCGLCFRHPEEFLDETAERAYYDTHENCVDDAGYRRFLSRLADVFFPTLDAGMRGLDFGCGPAQALVAMGREAGLRMSGYDPWFEDRPERLATTYDFVSCTETVEHFHRPLEGFATLDSLLAPGGRLGIMTGEPPAGREAFDRWHYHRDPTHVCFYNRSAMNWLAGHFGWSVEFPARNVSLFQKPLA